MNIGTKYDFETFRNPIHTVKENVPELVWDFFNEKVIVAISEMKLPNSKANSFRQTIKRYADGIQHPAQMYKFNYFIKEALIKELPIEDIKFFQGSFEEMHEAGIATAKNMITIYENLYKAQIAKLQTA